MPTSPLCTGMLVIVSAGAVGSALGLGLGLGDGEGAVVGLLVGVDAGVRDAVLLVGGVQAAARRIRPPNVAAARYPLLIRCREMYGSFCCADTS